MPRNPLPDLQGAVSRLWRKATGQPSLITDPRQKARILVQAIADATRTCTIEQRHLFGFQTAERQQALEQLALSLWQGTWHPAELSRDDVELIGYGWIADSIWAVDRGFGLNAIEAKIHELFRLHAEGKSLPELRPTDSRGRERSRLSTRPRTTMRNVRSRVG